MAEEHIRNLTREIESFKKSQLADPIKPLFDPIKPSSDPIKEKLYQAIVKDNTLNYAAYAAMIGISEATVKRRLGELKKAGIITRVGSNKNGHWEIIGKGDEL
jgi:predicted HTH transcriptional regulator